MLSLKFDKSFEPENILLLGAHCDDIEIGCGTSILKLIRDYPNATLHWIVFSSNEVREKEARISAEAPYADQTVELAIIDNETIEKEYGWVFFYQTKDYLETGNIVDALVGNAPYIVNRFTGELIETGTANPIEDYIAEYETRAGYAV